MKTALGVTTICSASDYAEREVPVRRRRLSNVVALWIVLCVALAAHATLKAQATAPSTAKTAKAWTAPRGPDGHPIISGVWSHNAATPMERPEELAGRAELTDEEVAALQRAAAQLFDGSGDAAFGDGVYIAALHNVWARQRASRREMRPPATTTRSGLLIGGSRKENVAHYRSS